MACLKDVYMARKVAAENGVFEVACPETIQKIRNEILAFNLENKHDGRMPKKKDMTLAKSFDLLIAIDQLGGFRAAARKFKLAFGAEKDKIQIQPHGLDKKLRTLAAELNHPYAMPTRKELLHAKEWDLYEAIVKNGGLRLVADRSGLEIKRNRPSHKKILVKRDRLSMSHHYSDIKNLETGLRRVANELGHSEIMPTREEGLEQHTLKINVLTARLVGWSGVQTLV